jgi:hypothetical protein
MNTHDASNHAPVSLYEASTTKRLVIRQELLDNRPAVLFVVEYDHELGSADCDTEELLTAEHPLSRVHQRTDQRQAQLH